MLEKILERDNMLSAYKRVKTNRGSGGVDGMTVEELQPYLKTRWLSIKAEILEGVYKPSEVKKIEIDKPDGGKRILGIPTAVDRMLQQSIAQQLQTIYDGGFSEFSYGFRPGSRAYQALRQVQEYLNEGYCFVIETDLEKFFDEVSHDRLMSILSRKIEQRSKGTPQGGPLSPLLSNIILDELDKELESRGHKFVRYADDLSIYVRSKKSAQRVKESAYRFIEVRMKLKVNRAKSRISRPQESSLLDFSFYKDAKVWQIRISSKSYERFKEKVREQTSKNWSIGIDARLGLLSNKIRGWVSYFRIAKCRNRIKDFDSWIRFRLRMCIWKTWKKVKTRIANLVRLGMDNYHAYLNGNTRKGYCRVAHSGLLSSTLTNEYFKNLGYVILEDIYLK